VNGNSFYKKNKSYFTKTEAHYFLSSRISYKNNSSVIAMYFEAKCKARNFAQSLCDVVIKTFTVKFIDSYDSVIVTGFLDLLARHTDYRFNGDELGDICDFINTKIIKKYEQPFRKKISFSFSGRTINSVIMLANEWHAEQQREIELRQRLGYGSRQAPVMEKWEGLYIPNFKYENNDCIWTIKQLCNIHELTNEGRRMKHCVASYAYKCAAGSCGIFNVSCKSRLTNISESIATVEVASDWRVVQIKGKCNSVVSGRAMNVITRWAQQNRIVIDR
jgi:hypothetical protein